MSQATHCSLDQQQQDGADLGNYYPTHHVLIAFEQSEQADVAHQALAEAGFDQIRQIDDKTMASASQKGLDSAGLLAAMGASLKMVELHLTLAKEGCHFLVVHAPSDEDTKRLMQVVRRGGFRIAQKYRRFVIETLD